MLRQSEQEIASPVASLRVSPILSITPTLNSPSAESKAEPKMVMRPSDFLLELRQKIEIFLTTVQTKLSHLKLSTVLISYVAESIDPVVTPSHVSSTDQQIARILAKYLTQAGIPAILTPFTTLADFNDQLAAQGDPNLIIICTPRYATLVDHTPGLRKAIDVFASQRADRLHTLLYEGGFRETALKVVDGHYLIRSCHTLQSQDPLTVCEAAVDILLHPSSKEGLGLLPDLLDLEKDEYADERQTYLVDFDALKTQQQRLTVAYRLQQGLIAAHAAHPFKPYFQPASMPEVIGQGRLELSHNSHSKVALLLCKTSADTALTGLALEESFIMQGIRAVSIDCGDYPGKAAHQCVQQALQKLKVHHRHTAVLSQSEEPVVILFKGYEQTGCYDNLYFKNQLRSWRNIKVLFTCRADFFQHRGYENCFLPDPTNPTPDSLVVYTVPSFASKEAQAFALSPALQAERDARQTAQANESASQQEVLPNPKLQAYQKEFSVFLEEQHRVFVERGFLKETLADNPTVFISYAWAAAGEPRTRQHTYLRRIVQDLSTLGFPTWLDIERMTGDIDEQMAGNIKNSRYALVIDTALYRERAAIPTNVQKEYQAIVAKQAEGKLDVFALQFNQFNTIPSASTLPFETLDFSGIDDGAVYIRQLNTLIIQLLGLREQALDDYHTATRILDQRLALLPGKHLLVDRGQDNVQAFDIDQRLIDYTKPYALNRSEDPFDTRFDLEEDFNTFLQQPTKTYVILGLAGSGKSLFTLATFKKCLQSWHLWKEGIGPQPEFLPIYIPLRNYANEKAEDAILFALKDYGLDNEDIENLRTGMRCNQKLLFILDGFDELGKGVQPNYPEKFSNWPTAKLLISSRPALFEENGKRTFATHPKDPDLSRAQQTFVIHYLSPFSSQEINEYIQRFDRGKAEYNRRILEGLPGLMPLLDNPFLLNLTLQALPRLLASRASSTSTHTQVVKRSDVYQAFIETLFNKEAFKREGSDSYSQADYHVFAQQLAFELFIAKEISISPALKEIWQRFFEDSSQVSLREACPLKRSGQEYTFIHKSVYEYFVACHLWAALGQAPDTRNRVWSARSLLEERAVIDFLAEFYTSGRPFDPSASWYIEEKEPHFTDLSLPLWSIVDASKRNPAGAMAAASAATILNVAGVSFIGRNLAHAHLPGADLSYAVLAYSELTNANLRRANLTHCMLYQTTLQSADLQDVRWGEYPYLQMEQEVTAIAHHPTQPWIAVAQGSVIILKDRDHGTVIGQPMGRHTGKITSVDFSFDGALLVSGSEDRTVYLWDTQTQQAIGQPMVGHTQQVTSVAFSPDGARVVSGSSDKTLWLWDTQTQQAVGQSMVGHTEQVTSVAFSPDGLYVVSGSVDKTLRLWDTQTQKAIGQSMVEHTEQVTSVAFSPDGLRVVSGGIDKTLRLWDTQTQKVIGQPMIGHTRSVQSVAFSPDGTMLVSGSSDKTVRLWDAGSQRPIGQPVGGHSDKINHVVFSSDGACVMSGSTDKTVRLWDTQAQQATRQQMQGHTDWVNSVTFSPDGTYVVSGAGVYDDYTVRLWDAQQQRAIGQPMHGHTSWVKSVAFSSDGTYIASGSGDKTVRLWDTKTQKPIGRLMEGHTAHVYSVAFSPDGAHLASGSHDKTIRLWDTKTQTPTGQPMVGHMGYVYSVAFSPDSAHLASGSHDKTIRLWDTKTQKPIGQPMEGHTDRMWSIIFSPDGAYLASGSHDKTVRLWDTKTQEPIGQPMAGHTGYVYSVAFSLDGTYVVSGSTDRTVRLWNVTQLKATGHSDGVVLLTWHQTIVSMAFAPRSLKEAVNAHAIYIPESSPCETAAGDDGQTLPAHEEKFSNTSLDPSNARLVAEHEDMLVIGDTVGAISFWALSYGPKPNARFLGMPKHSSMPLLPEGAQFTGCQMSPMAHRLLAQYGADVSQATVLEDTQPSVPTAAPAVVAETKTSISSAQPASANNSALESNSCFAALSPQRGAASVVGFFSTKASSPNLPATPPNETREEKAIESPP